MIIDNSIDKYRLKKYVSSNIGSDYQYYLTHYDTNFINYKIKAFCDTPKSRLFANIVDSEITALGRLRHLEWDSTVFDFKVAKITDLYGTGFSEKLALINAIKNYAQDDDYKLVVCRVAARDISSIHALEEVGFKWVDGMNIFVCDSNKTKVRSPSTCQADEIISELKRDELDASVKINELVLTFSKNGRLHNDPRISDNLVNDFYLNLFDSLVKKDKPLMLACRKNDKIVGFAIGTEDTVLKKYINTSMGYLWLIAVDEAVTGQGVGHRLLQAFIKKFSNRMGLIEVGTQMNNYKALNLYASSNLKMMASLVTMHLWL
jgi:ribosomal protein S18 acetylase RimI-like enzyme